MLVSILQILQLLIKYKDIDLHYLDDIVVNTSNYDYR